MHSTLISRVLALLAFIAVASLGIRAANDRGGLLEGQLAIQSPEIDHLCNLGHPLSACGFDVYPAGDLFIVEPSFG
jgi:hypothetical protein